MCSLHDTVVTKDHEICTDEKGKRHQKKVEITSSTNNSQVLPWVPLYFLIIADPREHVILQLSDCTYICD